MKGYADVRNKVYRMYPGARIVWDGNNGIYRIRLSESHNHYFAWGNTKAEAWNSAWSLLDAEMKRKQESKPSPSPSGANVAEEK